MRHNSQLIQERPTLSRWGTQGGVATGAQGAPLLSFTYRISQASSSGWPGHSCGRPCEVAPSHGSQAMRQDAPSQVTCREVRCI